MPEAMLLEAPPQRAPLPVLADHRDVWTLALGEYLANLKPATRRAYRPKLELFFGWVGLTPDRVLSAHVTAFRTYLETGGGRSGKPLSAASIGLHLAALSSFFAFLGRPRGAMGGALVVANPCSFVDRPTVEAYANPRKLSRSRFEAILEHLDRLQNVTALRDRALLLTYVFTMRRRAEIAALRGRDLDVLEEDRHVSDGGQTRSLPAGTVLYSYVGKGSKSRKRQLPPPAADAINRYLAAAGRGSLAELADDAPIFTSTRGRTAGAALTADGILRILKARAREAGVDPARIKTHGLRHLGAELRREGGATIEDVSALLDHSDLAVTTRYLKRLTGEVDASWEGVARVLGR